MTTLKSINQSIEEGNDDLEELNINFQKWFELQKRNRLDDLETPKYYTSRKELDKFKQGWFNE